MYWTSTTIFIHREHDSLSKRSKKKRFVSVSMRERIYAVAEYMRLWLSISSRRVSNSYVCLCVFVCGLCIQSIFSCVCDSMSFHSVFRLLLLLSLYVIDSRMFRIASNKTLRSHYYLGAKTTDNEHTLNCKFVWFVIRMNLNLPFWLMA